MQNIHPHVNWTLSTSIWQPHHSRSLQKHFHSSFHPKLLELPSNILLEFIVYWPILGYTSPWNNELPRKKTMKECILLFRKISDWHKGYICSDSRYIWNIRAPLWTTECNQWVQEQGICWSKTFVLYSLLTVWIEFLTHQQFIENMFMLRECFPVNDINAMDVPYHTFHAYTMHFYRQTDPNDLSNVLYKIL